MAKLEDNIKTLPVICDSVSEFFVAEFAEIKNLEIENPNNAVIRITTDPEITLPYEETFVFPGIGESVVLDLKKKIKIVSPLDKNCNVKIICFVENSNFSETVTRQLTTSQISITDPLFLDKLELKSKTGETLKELILKYSDSKDVKPFSLDDLDKINVSEYRIVSDWAQHLLNAVKKKKGIKDKSFHYSNQK